MQSVKTSVFPSTGKSVILNILFFNPFFLDVFHHHKFYMKPTHFYSKNLPRILAEKSNDSDIIEFLSELDMWHDDDEEEYNSQPGTRNHREPLKLELDVFDDYSDIDELSLQKKNRFMLYTGTFSVEDDEDDSPDERFEGCFFSFASKDESSASKTIDRSSTLMDILNITCSPFKSLSRNKSGSRLLCISTPFAFQDKVEESLAVPFHNEIDNLIPKTLVLNESIVVDDEHFIGTSVVIGISRESGSRKQDEHYITGDLENKLRSDTGVNNIKGLCTMDHVLQASGSKLAHFSPFACLMNGGVKSIISDLASLLGNSDDTTLVSEVDISVSSIASSAFEEERYSDKDGIRDAVLQEPDDYTKNDEMDREDLNQEESGKLLTLNAVLEDDEENELSSTTNTSDKYNALTEHSPDFVHPVGMKETLTSRLQSKDTSSRGQDMKCSKFTSAEGRLNTSVKQKMQERRLFREKVLLSLDE